MELEMKEMVSARQELTIKEKIQKLFLLAKDQTGQLSVVETAKKLYKKCDPDDWLSNFLEVLKYCLVFPEKSEVDRILRFVSKFTASLYSQKALLDDDEVSEDESECPFTCGLFNFIFGVHSATLVDVRLRCMALINYILSELPEDSWLPVAIWNGLAETVRTRLQDRNFHVRVAAVLVARKLQEPKNPDCEIVKVLSFHMTDPAPAVRRAVVSSIALNKVTFLDVIQRTLDINENVRRNAYIVISKVRYASLSIAQRILLLERGLQDRNERIRSCVETVLLPQWLDCVNNDVVALIEGWDVVNCSKVTLLALEALLKSLPLEEMVKALPLDSQSRTIKPENLSPEVALLWYFTVLQGQKGGCEEILDAIVPEITIFIQLISLWYPLSEEPPVAETPEEQWEDLKRKWVLSRLLSLAKLLDFTDEVGRLKLVKLCTTFLASSSVGCQLVPCLIELLRKVSINDSAFIKTGLEAFSHVREPLVQEPHVLSEERKIMINVEISKCKLTVHELKEEEARAVAEKNYKRAAEITSEINDVLAKMTALNTELEPKSVEKTVVRTDPDTVCKALKILMSTIVESGIKFLTPELLSLVDFVTSGLKSHDLSTQSLSIQVLGQYCILDQNLAQDYFLGFLLMLSENGDNAVNIPALKAVFDIVLIFGTEFLERLLRATDGDENIDGIGSQEDQFSSQNCTIDGKTPTARCLGLLGELLRNSSNEEMKVIVFQGFCKLLSVGVIFSPSLLKMVIIKGFTPVQENECEDHVKQFFMVFFPNFARTTSRSQEMIEAAFLPVMRRLLDAPFGSVEADTNARDVALFLIDHTRPGINPHTPSTIHVHNSLAISICLEIIRLIDEESEPEQIYLRCLLQLQLSLEDSAYTQQLQTLLIKIRRGTNEATGLRLVKQMQRKVQEVSTVSVQNTLDDDDRSRTCLSVGERFKGTLEQVNEEPDNVSIFNSSSESAKNNGKIVPESPDESD